MNNKVDPQRLIWLTARDHLLGMNKKGRNVKKALELAKNCTWPDAVWLIDIIERNGGMPDKYEELKIMVFNDRNDARAWTYYLYIGGYTAEAMRRPAEMGDALAQVILSRCLIDLKDRFEWAKKSAMQDEPEGLLQLGSFYTMKIVVGVVDNTKAEHCYRRAIELGNIQAFIGLAELYPISEKEYFLYLSKYVVASGSLSTFCLAMRDHVKAYCNNPSVALGKIVFQIGRRLVGQINRLNGELFGMKPYEAGRFNNACFALALYNSWCRFTREAVTAWTIVSTRNRLPRDIRHLIGKIIWDSRSQGVNNLINHSSGQ